MQVGGGWDVMYTRVIKEKTIKRLLEYTCKRCSFAR